MAYKFVFRSSTSRQTKKAAKDLFSDQLVKSLQNAIDQQTPIADVEMYNQFIKALMDQVRKHQKDTSLPSSLFDKEIGPIHDKTPLTEPVVWGGVSLKKVDVEKDFIQKLLVVGKFGILGFEIHEQKLEHLRVLEGLCLVLYSNHHVDGYKEGEVKMQLASVGDTFRFEPHDEHGIVALTNCVIEETSTNHLDDIVYIFKSSQAKV